ncbi:MAG: hypothetical protein U1E73_14055 [Planctomycetota bacterium]
MCLVVALGACAGAAPAAPDPHAGIGVASASYLATATTEAPVTPATTAGRGDVRDAVANAAPGAPDADPGGVAPATAAADPVAVERNLREELAGPEPTAAALELTALLCGLERHRDAVEVLQEARRRSKDQRLAIALAGVQRDLGQRHLAVAELRSVRRDVGAAGLHPAVLCDLAELEWLEGEREAAAATLAELRRVHGDDRWCKANEPALGALEADIARHDAPTRIGERDLFGNLRGAPLATVRIATLNALMGRVRAAAPSARRSALERRLLAIAGGDDSAALRVRAVQLGPPEGDDPDEFCAAALADADPLVRRAASQRTHELLGPAAAALLSRALATETDEATRAQLRSELDHIERGPDSGPARRP